MSELWFLGSILLKHGLLTNLGCTFSRVMKVKGTPTNWSLRVFSILILLIYSGLPDFLPIIKELKPGVSCVFLLTVLWLRSGFFKLDYKEPEVMMLTLLTLLTILSLYYAENTGVTIWLLETEVVYLMGLTIGAIQAIKTRKDLSYFIKLWIFMGLVISLLVIGNNGLGPSTLGDENDVSISILMVFPFLYYGTVYFTGIMKFVCIVAMVLALVALVVAGSRGGFLGLVTTVGMIFLFSRRKKVLLVLGSLSLTIAAVFLVSSEYRDEISSITEVGEGTADERLYSWILGIDIFLDNPVLGVGTGQYGWNVFKYQDDRGDLATFGGLRSRKHLGGRTSHSTYIDFICERGIVGLILIVILIRSVLKRLGHCRKLASGEVKLLKEDSAIYFSYAMTCALAGYAVSSLFVATYFFPNFWLAVGLVIAVSRIADLKTPVESRERELVVSFK